MSLTLALADGRDIYLMDGIYTRDTLNIPAGITMQAAEGARPIIVHSDGYPPAINRGAGATVSGIWFGGLRPPNDTGYRTVTNGAGGGFSDCTFFNYINGLQDGSTGGNTHSRNRFVNCGYGTLLHPVYISSLNTLVEENIVIGGMGWGVHLYHEPAGSVAQYNFIGDTVRALALQGDVSGAVSGNRNIIWTVASDPLYNVTALGTCNNNVWRGCSRPDTPDDSNYFVDPVPTSGTNPVVWQESDVVANLGNSSANIDAAIAALEASFAESVATIQADATIETKFATLKAVIDTWKTK